MTLRFWGALGLILLLIAIPFLAISQLLPAIDAAHWENATETTGQIVGFSGSGPKPLVSFVASNGDPYVFEATSYSSQMVQGQIVTVRYYLKPNLKASLKINLTPLQLGFGITGCVLATLSFTALILQWRKSSLKKQLLQYGTRYEATVTEIDYRRNVRVNRRCPMVVTCSLRDPNSIGEKQVKSGWILTPPPGLRVGSKVPVLMDAYRPTQHYVLVEEAVLPTAENV